jgi:hypothetical protein
LSGRKIFDHHISFDDALEHTRQLRDVVRPWVRAGAVSDDFESLDQSLGREDVNRYSETYRLFYGNSSVRIDENPDGTFNVIGGTHRIFLARKLNIGTIPVRIETRQG